MANIALKWLKEKGFEWRDIPPEVRRENIARMLASQPTQKARSEQIAHLRRLHGKELVDELLERAREIYYQRRRA